MKHWVKIYINFIVEKPSGEKNIINFAMGRTSRVIDPDIINFESWLCSPVSLGLVRAEAVMETLTHILAP